MSKQIKVICNPDGTVQVEAVGFKGSKCLAATQFMEEALGLENIKQTKKPDYYQEEVRKVQRT